jgi:hypothetical protein
MYKCIKIMGKYKFGAPSKTKNKKYDAWKKINGDWKRIASFGDIRYQHYKDKIGCFKNLDHGDINRRRNYNKRHAKDKTKAGYDQGISPGYLSMKYLW